jgi:flagellar protein FlaG
MLLSPTNGTAPLPESPPRPPQPEIRAQAPAAPPTDARVAANTQNNDNPAPAEVQDALKTLNDYTALVAQDVSFTMDEESGKTIVKVVDTATQEVLRQFPSAEALSIARSIDKMQGLLIREKA